MDSPAQYIHLGFILLSVPNLVMIGLMFVLFAAALIVPFPHRGSKSQGQKL
jgi:hypothetical protein